MKLKTGRPHRQSLFVVGCFMLIYISARAHQPETYRAQHSKKTKRGGASFATFAFTSRGGDRWNATTCRDALKFMYSSLVRSQSQYPQLHVFTNDRQVIPRLSTFGTIPNIVVHQRHAKQFRKNEYSRTDDWRALSLSKLDAVEEVIKSQNRRVIWVDLDTLLFVDLQSPLLPESWFIGYQTGGCGGIYKNCSYEHVSRGGYNQADIEPELDVYGDLWSFSLPTITAIRNYRKEYVRSGRTLPLYDLQGYLTAMLQENRLNASPLNRFLPYNFGFFCSNFNFPNESNLDLSVNSGKLTCPKRAFVDMGIVVGSISFTALTYQAFFLQDQHSFSLVQNENARRWLIDWFYDGGASMRNDVSRGEIEGFKIFPHLQGGLGNQLFIMSAASILANVTNRRVVLDAKQSGVHSYGHPQPTHIHTVFSNPFFHKDANYDELEARLFSERDWVHSFLHDWSLIPDGSVYVSGPFLNFSYFWKYRSLLQQLYAPRNDVQEWVNHAAVELELVIPDERNSANSWNETEMSNLFKGNTMKHDHIQGCDRPPAPCEVATPLLRCKSAFCRDNIAVHIRLEDKSSFTDYWDNAELQAAMNIIQGAVMCNKNVVIFSNDLARAKALVDKHKNRDFETELKFSNSNNVIEFYLMSQFFGVHLLSGSSFQQWAIFLSMLPIQVLHFDSIREDFGLNANGETDTNLRVTNVPKSHLINEKLRNMLCE